MSTGEILYLAILALFLQVKEAVWAAALVAVTFGAATAVIGGYRDRRDMRALFTTGATASIVGFVVGDMSGLSRDSVMGDVLPAALSVLGGFFAYVLVLDKRREARFVSAFLIVFALALSSGVNWGAFKRVTTEQTIEFRKTEAAVKPADGTGKR